MDTPVTLSIPEQRKPEHDDLDPAEFLAKYLEETGHGPKVPKQAH